MEKQREIPATENARTGRTASVWGIGRSLGAKFFTLCLLALLLCIPLWSVSSLKSERAWTAREAANDIGQMSGGKQSISGPFIQVPFLADNGKGATVRRVAVILPDDLTIDGNMATEIRYRSIFEVPVYRNTLRIKASFKPIDINAIATSAVRPLWNEAVVALGVADRRGLVSQVRAVFDSGQSAEFQSGIPVGMKSGIHASLREVDPGKPITVSIDMQVNGSSAFSIAAIGKTSLITMVSDWRHPSFKGQFLPEQRKIDDKGFSATWRTSPLARSAPATFIMDGDETVSRNSPTGNAYSAGSALFSDDDVRVELYTPADLYQRVERALKYGLLFIGGMFLAVFGLEVASRGRMHAAQYLLFGFALVLFYVLLLSFAEHIGFNRAYLVASAATMTLTASYVGMALRSLIRGVLLFVILAVAYGLLYMLLQMEDYALLIGSIVIFAALATLMFATLRTDWSAVPAAAERPPSGGAA